MNIISLRLKTLNMKEIIDIAKEMKITNKGHKKIELIKKITNKCNKDDLGFDIIENYIDKKKDEIISKRKIDARKKMQRKKDVEKRKATIKEKERISKAKELENFFKEAYKKMLLREQLEKEASLFMDCILMMEKEVNDAHESYESIDRLLLASVANGNKNFSMYSDNLLEAESSASIESRKIAEDYSLCYRNNKRQADDLYGGENANEEKDCTNQENPKRKKYTK